MKKHQLLEEAMRRFPAGTKCTWGGDPITSTGVFRILKTETRTAVEVVGGQDHESHVYDSSFYQSWAKPVKPSILEGKVSIQVNNEREFKLLMEHYESKGWYWNGSKRDLSYRPNVEYPFSIWYENEFVWDIIGELEDRISIPFSEFAAEVGIKVPVFIMKSEDGKNLYEGDKYHAAWLSGTKWKVGSGSNLNRRHEVCTGVNYSKAFSTLEAAEKWIEEQNKPKSIELPHTGGSITISRSAITFNTDEKTFSGSYLEKIWNAYQSLKGGDK